MQFEKLIVLLPLSRIDPDPSELTDRIARSTLEGYQALWHPGLLCRSASVPEWACADTPPTAAEGELILIPDASRDFLPYDWELQAEGDGAHVVAGEEGREQLLERIWESLPTQEARVVGGVVAPDFMALGLARLWLEMLVAYMGHVSTLDEDQFQREVLAAASAAVLEEPPQRNDHLQNAFELLKDAREQLYPVDVHLLDLCLVHPRAGMDRLAQQLAWQLPVNVFMSGSTARKLQELHPDAAAQLLAALEDSRAEIVGSEYEEEPSTLLPLESHLWQFKCGERSYREVFERVPQVYGRRQFGMARYVFQLIGRLGKVYATHFCFDDGVIPVAEDAKVLCEAPDTSTMEVLTRIPLATTGPIELFSLPHHLAHTMSADLAATLPLVHWAGQVSPWYEDLLRITKHSPVFGQFSTLSSFFQNTDIPVVSTQFSDDQYASPFLASAHSASDPQPISRFARHHRLRAGLETIRLLRAVLYVVERGDCAASVAELEELERLVETNHSLAEERLGNAEGQAARALASRVVQASDSGQRGVLVFNSLGFDRTVAVPLLEPTGSAAAEQAGGAESREQSRFVALHVPAMGFAWASESPAEGGPADPKEAVFDGSTLRNGLLEVEIDPETGGIRALRDRATGFPHIGQRLVLLGIPDDLAELYDSMPEVDSYGLDTGSIESKMRLDSLNGLCAGPEVVEVVVEGELLAEPCPTWASGPRMARFRQRYRLLRGATVVELRLEILDLVAEALDPQAGPWQSYLASRFAWRDPRSRLVRAVGPVAGSAGPKCRRPETPYFLELHGTRHRTAILTGGLPFHQRQGDRMLDTLLVTPTESGRQFDLALGLDLPEPFQSALELVTSPVMIRSEDVPAPGRERGWFFHLDARNVITTSLAPMDEERRGIRVRLFESAGLATTARLRCVRQVRSACMTDFCGQQLVAIEPEGDTIRIELMPHEMAQLEITFAR